MHRIAHLARRLISDDPARTSPLVTPASAYSHWAAWPSAPDPHRVALGVHTHTAPLPDRHARWEPGPTHIHVLAHGPVLGPHFRISIRAAPQRLTPRSTIRHPGSAQHLSAQRQRSTRSAAPSARRSAYCGSTHSPKVTSSVMGCLPERPLLCSAAQAGCGCSTAGWLSSVPAREDVRHDLW